MRLKDLKEPLKKQFLPAMINGALGSLLYFNNALTAEQMGLAKANANFGVAQTLFLVPTLGISFFFPMIGIQNGKINADMLTLANTLSIIASAIGTTLLCAYFFFAKYALDLDYANDIGKIALGFIAMGLLQGCNFNFAFACYGANIPWIPFFANLYGLVINTAINLLNYSTGFNSPWLLGVALSSAAAIGQYTVYENYLLPKSNLFQENKRAYIFDRSLLPERSSSFQLAAPAIGISLMIEMLLPYMMILSQEHHGHSDKLGVLNILVPLKTLLFLLPVEFINAISSFVKNSIWTCYTLTLLASAFSTVVFLAIALPFVENSWLTRFMAISLFFDSHGFESGRMVSILSQPSSDAPPRINNTQTIITAIVYAATIAAMHQGWLSDSPEGIVMTLSLGNALRDLLLNGYIISFARNIDNSEHGPFAWLENNTRTFFTKASKVLCCDSMCTNQYTAVLSP